MKSRDLIEDAFAAVPLFSRLSGGQRSRLAKLATVRAYRPESIIVRQGDTSMALYVVLRGRARVEHEFEQGTPPLSLGELGPCGFFGEMGLIDDMPRAATVRALDSTDCALLAKWDFRNELRQDPDIALALLPILTQRIREAEARLEQMEQSHDRHPVT
jgi:CRP-like cAMP-binding protein